MQLSRRDMLASLLSLPAAISACKKAPRFPPGELAFRPEILGHKIRDHEFTRVPESEVTREKVVIVGGGVAGLAAAWRLSRAGFSDYVITELEDVFGGTARGGNYPASAVPWGAHYITMPMAHNRALIALLAEMGVVDHIDAQGEPVAKEEFLCRDPEERVFYLGKWHEGLVAKGDAFDSTELDRFFGEVDKLAALRDSQGRRAFAIPRALSSNDATFTALDRITFTEWLETKGFRDERVQWLCDYACRDDYGTHANNTSAWAGLFYFAARKRTPGAPMQPVVTWPEGNSRLIAHLASRVTGKRMLGVGVANLSPSDAGVNVAAIDRKGGRLGFLAEHVIFAAPQFIARAVIEPWRENAPTHVAAFEYSPWMVANISLSERPKQVGFAFAWDSVLYDSPSLGYVTATHQTGRDRGPTVVTYYYPLVDADATAARKKLLATGRDEWADVAMTDLAAAHPDIFSLATQLDVARWGHAMVRPKPGLLFGGALEKARAPYRNVYFANTDLSGVALFEEAFFHGIRAAEEVLTARQIPFPSLLA